MSNPPLTEYKDDGCRYVEWHWLKKHRFDNRDDLIEAAYPDADHGAWLRGLASSPHKDALQTYLTNIIRNDRITLEEVRQNLRVIAGDAGSDPFTQVTGMMTDLLGSFFDNDPVVEPESVLAAEPKSGTPSSPERKLSRQETKVASKRKVAKNRAKELHGKDFVPSQIYNPIIKQLRELHGSGQTREAILDALEGLIAPVRADLTNTQIDLLYRKANELLDGLYRPEEVMRTLLNPPTNGDRSKYKSALYLLLQIQTRYKVGEEFAMPDKDMAGLAGVSKAKGSLDEVKGALCKLKAIEQIHRGKRSAKERIATTYRRLI